MSVRYETFLCCDLSGCDEDDWGHNGKGLPKSLLVDAKNEGWQEIAGIGDVCPEHTVSEIIQAAEAAKNKPSREGDAS